MLVIAGAPGVLLVIAPSFYKLRSPKLQKRYLRQQTRSKYPTVVNKTKLNPIARRESIPNPTF